MADPVCWKDVREDVRGLSRQRRRSHRGLGQTLWRHREAVGNPRYGAFGVLALPYFVLFELLGTVIETFGSALTVLAFALGDLSTRSFVAFLLLAFLVGIVLSIAALALEEFNFRRHRRTRDVVSMVLYSVLENFGYRQVNDMWRVLALVDLARRSRVGGRSDSAGHRLTSHGPRHARLRGRRAQRAHPHLGQRRARAARACASCRCSTRASSSVTACGRGCACGRAIPPSSSAISTACSRARRRSCSTSAAPAAS